jgi:Xaa-Pro aminopeptidase
MIDTTTSMKAAPALTIEGCRRRQAQLLDRLSRCGLDGVLIADARHVHYLTGYRCRSIFTPLVWVERDGRCTLIAPLEPDAAIAADLLTVYCSNRRGTLESDQPLRAIEAAAVLISGAAHVGCDGALARGLLPGLRTIDVSGDLRAIRRYKGDDEVAILRFALAAAEAAYAAIRPMLEPGVCETRIWAAMQAAAAEFVGETLGEFGNDFQVGALGSAPRRRPAKLGEVAILDLGVTVRGYAGDMCRSFVIGGEPSRAQQKAHAAITTVLEHIEAAARPGTRCRALHEAAIDALDGPHGWAFKHHLGHGIGLDNHEAPRLNVEWDDSLEVGDVFTVEPGLYGEDLRAGLRIEQVYRMTAAGAERLTHYPIALT